MPNMQYIKHDILQIYIFKSYVWFQIKEIAKRWLYYKSCGLAARPCGVSWQRWEL